jgi:hypothetical protein
MGNPSSVKSFIDGYFIGIKYFIRANFGLAWVGVTRYKLVVEVLSPLWFEGGKNFLLSY